MKLNRGFLFRLYVLYYTHYVYFPFAHIIFLKHKRCNPAVIPMHG